MEIQKTAKYVKETPTRQPRHNEITTMVPTLTSDADFGNLGFKMYWQTVTVPFAMATESHKHDFPQYLIFLGTNPDDLLDFGAEIELTLSEDGENLEKHIITRATEVYLPAGLYHCPLVFTKVVKPILIVDIFFSENYARKYGGAPEST
jgi:hypothetical protein